MKKSLSRAMGPCASFAFSLVRSKLPPQGARPSEGPTAAWLEDAASGDAERGARAARAAAEATEADVAALTGLLAEDPIRARGALALLRALPASPARDDLAVAVLTLADAQPAWVRALGPAVAARVLGRLFDAASPAVVGEALALLPVALDAADEAERTTLAETLDRRLAQPAGPWSAAVFRAVAVLRPEGFAPKVLTHLRGVEEPAVRAAGAHALSRLPDLAPVRVEATALLAELLFDGERDVRVAARLLAEALLSEPCDDYVPDGGEAQRRAAADVILDRLQKTP